MKIYRIESKESISQAIKRDDGFFELVCSDYETITPYALLIPEDKVKILAPCEPSKVVGVGLNYLKHSKELKMDLPKTPLIFIKPANSVIGPNDSIVYPAMSKRVDYEAELAVVIKKTCKNVTVAKASDYIAGYTCLNDVTARDLQEQESQWTRAKGFDTFCPIGPYIDTEFNWRGKRITAKLNGKIVQDDNTDNMIFSVEEIVSFVSKIMTLNPQDVIATGTPAGIGPMQRGDAIEVSIEGILPLKNRVE